jgi:hypothetical protein
MSIRCPFKPFSGLAAATASGLVADDFAPLQFRDLSGAEFEFGKDILGLLAELRRRRAPLAGVRDSLKGCLTRRIWRFSALGTFWAMPRCLASKSFASQRHRPIHANVASPDPSAGQNFESLCQVRTFDDFDLPFADALQSLVPFAASMFQN